MVTVRLSEPPSLSVNTDLPPATLPSRRSIFGPECTPTSAVATPARETESIIEEEECESPRTLNAKTPSNLAEELRDSVSSSDDRDQSSDDDDMDDSDTEEVNWEKLQKTEDEEVRDQDDNDNVCYTTQLMHVDLPPPRPHVPVDTGSLPVSHILSKFDSMIDDR